ncbi:DUF3784 domain-containing protein [Ruegeria meonggei]|uniref:DUF2244 domain-containing protein n=1 Tax=Ruegeria meonggei TaxID=1446476 RepID=A0A1X7ACB9_9RHOB|nr:DUF3784 domain-containing protein [Ruegeria meonggei]SLN74089.1 hypothetical protein RUM8411_03962 [Ruegeria meonggei]
MKIARNTPTQLILTDIPWFYGVLFAFNTVIFIALGLILTLAGGRFMIYGLVLIIGGGAFGFWTFHKFVRRVLVIFDRATQTLEIREKSIFGYEAIEHPLTELSHAEVESTLPKGSFLAPNQHRPVLVLDQGMSAGRHPIVTRYTKGSDTARLVDVINDWLTADKVDSDSQSA